MEADATEPNLRILILEDEPTDAELVAQSLREAGMTFITERVEDKAAFVRALEAFKPDIVLADYKLPAFDGATALGIVRETHPEVPVVMVTGTLGDVRAVELLKAGAKDYVLKDGLARLAPAVHRALADERSVRARKAAEIKYRRLFEAAREGILIVDAASGVIVDANPFMRNLLGYEAEELVGKALWDIGSLKDAVSSRSMFGELQDKEYVRYEHLPLETKDGRRVDVEFVSNVYPVDGRKVVQCNIRDISERVRARELLASRERYFSKLIEGSADAFFVIDQAGTVVYRSPSGKHLTGWDDADVLGNPITTYVVAEDLPLARQAIARAIENPERISHVELRLLRKDGTTLAVEATGRNLLADPDVAGIVATARDITERKNAERALAEREELFRSVAKLAQDALIMVDDDANIVLWNDAAARMFGYSNDEALGKNVHTLLAPRRFHEAMQSAFPAFRLNGKGAAVGRTQELAGLRKDGTEFPIELSLSSARFSDRWHAIGIIRDITERKQAEVALRNSEGKLRTLVSTLPDLIWLKDMEGVYLDCNPKFESFFGARVEEIIGKTDYDFVDKALADFFRDHDRKAMAAGRPSMNEEWLTFADTGYHGLFETLKMPMRDQAGTLIGVLGVARDITERHQSQLELQRANRALHTLSACNMALVHAESEPELLQSICRLLVETGGYRMAWVGYAEQDAEKTLRPVAHHGDADGYLTEAKFSWADTDLGRGPSGTAVRTGTVQVNNNMLSNQAMAPWREAALKRGFQSSIALPLAGDAGVIGALTIDAAEPNSFGEPEIALLGELAGDLAFGIRTLRARDENRRAAERLEHSMEDTIEAMAATVEKRDPYTAGHQVRVAQLAVAIGQEMGVSEQQLHGLRLGATIHDIGKIYIPAEILNRPGRLGEFEIGLIRTHAQVGYDIVKDVDFMWPVKEMIVQHHERMDGSGYPAGLKGEQIILEARILAVADVVEAMSSHRPYRPALGVARAMEEIRLWRGKGFDPRVVDACLRLFAEKRFDFDFGQ